MTSRLIRAGASSAFIIALGASVTWLLSREPGRSSAASIVGLIASLVVGAVFSAAGASKVSDRPRWQADAPNLGTPLLLVPVIPWFELIVGGLMIVGLGWPAVPLVAAATLVAFSVAIGLQLAAGRQPRCACFGSWSAKPVSVVNIVRNAVWVGLAILSLLR